VLVLVKASSLCSILYPLELVPEEVEDKDLGSEERQSRGQRAEESGYCSALLELGGASPGAGIVGVVGHIFPLIFVGLNDILEDIPRVRGALHNFICHAVLSGGRRRLV
jgi:hypothetical protein